MVLALASLAWAELLFTRFSANEQGGQVVIEWTTANEGGCSLFVLERSLDGATFYERATFDPQQGSTNEYRYTDTDFFKNTSRTYHYRVRAEMPGGSVYSGTESVSVSISGIQQTWGSLKAIFR